MESKDFSSKPFRFSDPRQERIHRRLRLVGPGPASFYRDACRLMTAESPLEATTHLVAHLLREIESGLRDVLESLMDRSERLTNKNVSGNEKHETEIRAVLNILKISETDPVAQVWLRLTGQKNYYGLAARAHRDDLVWPRPVDQKFRKFWDDMETVLDIVLEKFESRYLESFHVLDRLLTKPSPTQADAKTLRLHVPNNLVAFSYFFDKLTTPAWLEPLRAEGFFKRPPEPDHGHERGATWLPPWPQSRYLARMAALEPETVIEVMLQIPETENVRVHEDLADAALAMPPELAARWVRSQQHLYFLLPKKLGELVSHLARGGQVEEALDLVRVLLAVLPDPRAADGADEDETFRLLPEPCAGFDSWYYQEILKKHMPDVVAVAGERALTMLCDLLDNVIRLSRHSQEDEGPEDYSCIWRPAIEDHSQNQPHRLRDFLVSAVRDAAEALMETKGKAVLDIIEKRSFKVFQRIGLYLRRKWPDVDPEGTACLVADPAVFDDAYLRHEFFHLLQEQFSRLPLEARHSYLDLVERGTDVERWLDLRECESGHRPSQEEAERYVRRWQYTKIWPVQQFLDQEWRQRFNTLKQEFGELEHPDFLSYGTSWTGPTSPKEVEDLRSMSIEELISFLKTWKPPEGPMTPSPEGLGRKLAALVASEPRRFSAEAGRFRGLDPTYVHALLSGLRDAAKQKTPFPWRPVLDLCRWVIDQPREIPGRKGEYADLDPGWVWTRKTIADLLSSGFKSDSAEIPFDFRAVVWNVLRPLTDDPNPTLEYEAQYGGSNRGPATLSINTTRGEAMHAVVRYALWVRGHIKKTTDGKKRIARGFDEMPEVREVLDRHLEPDHDPALAIRAVYGQWLPQLVFLDARWTSQSVTKIFPMDETLHNLRDAAWETYVVFCTPYDEVFDVLHQEYARAIEQIGIVSKESRHLVDERLAEHLMIFYWRGKLNLDDPEGLLARFYAKAPDALRGHALEFVGRSLHNTKGQVASQVLGCLQALWMRRIHAARIAEQLASSSAELAAFGWWFVSAKFDEDWAVTQLKAVLKLSSRIERDRLVVERLAALSAEMPAIVLDCLSLMVEGDKEGQSIYGWRKHMRTILGTAIQSTDDTVRQTAVNLIHRLGARGYLDFRDLLAEG